MLDVFSTPEAEIRHCIETAEVLPETEGQTVARLSCLSALEYYKVRKAEATRLGVGVSALDNEVRQHRLQSKAAEKSSVTLFPEPDIWHSRVMAHEVLSEVAALFRRYAVLPAHTDTALALWVTFTWCIDAFKVAPILALTSPEKRCGKTTVLSLVSRLVRRPLPTSNISPSALFRAVEKWQPTVLIDEADCFLKDSDELRGILNSGHTVTSAFVIRTVGEDHEPTRFSTWAAKAIALIGTLPDTLHDRSVIVELRRKLTEEKPEKLRHAEDDLFEKLQSKLARFAMDNMQVLRKARPALITDISDRAADNWEPLLAIAELAGNEWKEKAMRAARALSGFESDAPSIGVELLADIKEVFEAKGIDKISSAELISALCEDDEKPWVTYNRGKPLSARQFSKRLKEYHIHNKPLRIGYEVVRGFEKGQFHDAFIRYLSTPSPESVTSVNTLQSSIGALSSVAEKEHTNNGNSYTQNTATNNLLNNNVCYNVTDVTDNLPPLEQGDYAEVTI